jgi:hypothetical protein
MWNWLADKSTARQNLTYDTQVLSGIKFVEKNPKFLPISLKIYCLFNVDIHFFDYYLRSNARMDIKDHQKVIENVLTEVADQ